MPIKFSRHKLKKAYQTKYANHIFRFYFTITPRNSVPDCYFDHKLVLEFAPLQFFFVSLVITVAVVCETYKDEIHKYS